MKGEGAIVEHSCGEFAYNGLCLSVQVPHHGVAVPAGHETDVIHIDVACEHSHGAGGAKRACADVARVYSSAMEIETHGSTQCVSYILRFDCRATGGCIVGRDGNVLA
jgi:hypothetical protein